MKRLRTLVLLLVLGSGAPGCTAVIGLEPLDDGTCGEGLKACGEVCVGLDDRRFGCAAPRCTPCFLDNATEICGPAGECAIAACERGFDDCDRVRENGCETDLEHDVDHCGRCRNPCSLVHSDTLCTSGLCGVRLCDPGWGDCDTRADTGCETDLRLAAHCGDCGTVCTVGQSCVSGDCVP